MWPDGTARHSAPPVLYDPCDHDFAAVDGMVGRLAGRLHRRPCHDFDSEGGTRPPALAAMFRRTGALGLHAGECGRGLRFKVGARHVRLALRSGTPVEGGASPQGSTARPPISIHRSPEKGRDAPQRPSGTRMRIRRSGRMAAGGCPKGSAGFQRPFSDMMAGR
jgi:hypothetical protein